MFSRNISVTVSQIAANITALCRVTRAQPLVIAVISFSNQGSQGSDDGRLDEDLSRLQGTQLTCNYFVTLEYIVEQSVNHILIGTILRHVPLNLAVLLRFMLYYFVSRHRRIEAIVIHTVNLIRPTFEIYSSIVLFAHWRVAVLIERECHSPRPHPLGPPSRTVFTVFIIPFITFD